MIRYTLLTFVLLMNISCKKDSDDGIDWFLAVKGAQFGQVDRVGMPGTDNFFVSNIDLRAAMNQGQPINDITILKSHVRLNVQSVRDGMAAVANASYPLLNEISVDDATSLAVPNVIALDLSQATSFPANGRKLTDDVYDSVLKILFDRELTDDVSETPSFESEFPFVNAAVAPASAW